jgi:hypothetical protein
MVLDIRVLEWVLDLVRHAVCFSGALWHRHGRRVAVGMPLSLEHWPPHCRGLASGLLQGGWYQGFIVSALTFHFVYPIFSQLSDPFSESSDSTIAWRVMFLTS